MEEIEIESEIYKDNCLIYEDLEGYINHVSRKACKELTIIHLNIGSVRNKWALLNEILEYNIRQIDVIVLTESSVYDYENELYKINGYANIYYNRTEQKGGGICVYVKEDAAMKVISNSKNSKSGHECIHIEIELRNKIIDIIAIYRPPEFNKVIFSNELTWLLSNIGKHHEIILIGDINIDLLKMNENPVSNYQNLLAEQGLGRCIYGITREAMKNGIHVKSCIDHIYVRTKSEVMSSIVHTHVSDHYMIAMTLYTGGRKGEGISDEKTSDHNKFQITRFEDNKIKTLLMSLNWDEKIGALERSGEGTDTLYNAVKNEFANIYNNSMKVTERKVSKRTNKNWLTENIKRELKERDSAFKRWKNTPTNANYRNEYTKIRNKVNRQIIKRKNEYASMEIERVKGSIRDTWIKVNDIIGRGSKNRSDELIVKSFSKIYSFTEILNHFAMEFTQGVAQIVHDCNMKLYNRKQESANYSMFIPSAKIKDIEKIIQNMSCNKAPGLDKIRALDIRNGKEGISHILTRLVNLSINEGITPNELKISIIKPIYKQGTRSEFSNYRPIAILATIEKILERYISVHLNKFLTKHNIINEQQYGFQRGRSTTTLLCKFTDFINSKLNSNKVVLALFIDYSKAFDTINHKTLLNELERNGIRGKLHKWFKNYLRDRQIQVKLENKLSDAMEVNYGVPQGSILGPTMYTIYVNTIFKCMENCEIFMFADDTAMLSVHRDAEEAQKNMQHDYNNLLKWSHDNGLKINYSKTKLLCITTSKRYVTGIKIYSHTNDCLHERSYNTDTCRCPLIEEVREIKYLGMTIDNRLTWSAHTAKLCKSLRGCLFQFYKLQHCVNVEVLKKVYHALVQSIIRYGLSCYGNCSATNMSKIESINKRILKIIARKKQARNINTEGNDVYKITHILPVKELYKYINIVDNYYKEEYKFKLNSDHQLRNEALRIPRSYNNYGEKQQKIEIPKLLNTIPEGLRKLDTLHKVKREIKNWLLNS